MSGLSILIRPHKAEDLSFVFDTYLSSWRISKWAGCIPNHLYYECQRVLLEDLIGRGAKILVAYPEGHEDIILGWVCGEVKEGKTVVHYVFVRDSGVSSEVADNLVEALPGTKPGFMTHKMFLGALKNWTHTPEIARRKSL